LDLDAETLKLEFNATEASRLLDNLFIKQSKSKNRDVKLKQLINDIEQQIEPGTKTKIFFAKMVAK
jgi:hypothetical protein